MSTNRRFLKAFGRLDASGRLVPGSVVLRKKKPTKDRWIELDTYQCCDGINITSSGAGSFPYSGGYISAVVACSVGHAGLTTKVAGTPASVTALVETLNEASGSLGVFGTDGTNVILTLKQSLADGIDCTGTLTLTITDAS